MGWVGFNPGFENLIHLTASLQMIILIIFKVCIKYDSSLIWVGLEVPPSLGNST